jgi:single-strand DNA-binding protein
MTLPTITATGNLTSDGELRFTATGVAIYTTGLACNRSKKNGESWETTHTTFLSIKLWEADAETAAEHLRKGDRVIVTGELLVEAAHLRRTVANGEPCTELAVDETLALRSATAAVRRCHAKRTPAARTTTGRRRRPSPQPTQQAWATDTVAPF